MSKGIRFGDRSKTTVFGKAPQAAVGTIAATVRSVRIAAIRHGKVASLRRLLFALGAEKLTLLGLAPGMPPLPT